MLRRHLADAHGLGTDQYRKRWNLRSDYPMVAPAYSERRSGLAKQLVWVAADGNPLRATPHQSRSQLRHRSFVRHHHEEEARQSSRPRFLSLRTIGTEAHPEGESQVGS